MDAARAQFMLIIVSPTTPRERPVLVTGATGYVGGRLVPRLLARGHRVRAMSRSRAKLAGRPWANHPRVELVEGDALDKASLTEAVGDSWAVYYLVHSMAKSTRDFAELDVQAARAMAEVAAATGVERILYLGGLGDPGDDLSPHLQSRRDTGHALREGTVPVTELRAAVILGSGSAAFEILRYLVERLPIMITPRWLTTPSSPIAIRNVLEYLIGCLEVPSTANGIFEIGGPEVVTYRRLMEIYQEEAGLRKRLVIPVPVLTPKLSSYWIHLVTPAPAHLAQPLAEGLRNPVVCTDHRIRELIPQRLLAPREAVRLAVQATQRGKVESHWTDAGILPPAEWSQPGDPAWTGGTVLEDSREALVDAPPEDVWRPIVQIGGQTGWYYANRLWRLRGRLDKLVGGVGDRRGRRHASELRPGDALDFWRVIDVDAPRRLLLGAEMRLPGRAVLEFTVDRVGDGMTTVTQTARYAPRGLLGLAYWYAVYPLHGLVFRGMLRGIRRAAEDASGRPHGGGSARRGATRPGSL